MHSEESWNERYRAEPSVWSGDPNPHLVTEVRGLASGNALDAACGEGADAIWLARRGWRVTAVDFASVALERGAQAARDAGGEIAERIAWLRADLTAWAPPRAAYDLVTTHFLHIPREPREAVFRGLAAAVAPGGVLLIVAHDASDLHTGIRRPRTEEFYFTAGDVAAALDPARWEMLEGTTRQRGASDREGRTVRIRDVLVKARRRSDSA